MSAIPRICGSQQIFTPALVFFKQQIEQNIAEAVRMVGDPQRLRPHVKTHKTREIVRMELKAGVGKHKVATLAEAEMVASCDAPDVLLAYPVVGPNVGRLIQLMRAYPRCRFSVTMDNTEAVHALSAAVAEAGLKLDVLLDLDVGMHRTGIAPSPEAASLYERIHRSPGLRADGLHVYDGHNHQASLAEREAAVRELMEPVLGFRTLLEGKGMPVPRMVAGGTPTFPVFARMNLPGLECSPGTCVLHDNGYGSMFTEMSGFVPAALLLTRVISKPTPTRLTLDLGYKAIASDPPAGKRLVLLGLDNYTAVLQNEEHLVIETPEAENIPVGKEFLAVPTHICPTCAMHQRAYVIEDGQVIGTWDIVARDRVLRY
jgi:D-threonine aldolase